MKIRKYIILLGAVLALAACSKKNNVSNSETSTTSKTEVADGNANKYEETVQEEEDKYLSPAEQLWYDIASSYSNVVDNDDNPKDMWKWHYKAFAYINKYLTDKGINIKPIDDSIRLNIAIADIKEALDAMSYETQSSMNAYANMVNGLEELKMTHLYRRIVMQLDNNKVLQEAYKKDFLLWGKYVAKEYHGFLDSRLESYSDLPREAEGMCFELEKMRYNLLQKEFAMIVNKKDVKKVKGRAVSKDENIYPLYKHRKETAQKIKDAKLRQNYENITNMLINFEIDWEQIM